MEAASEFSAGSRPPRVSSLSQSERWTDGDDRPGKPQREEHQGETVIQPGERTILPNSIVRDCHATNGTLSARACLRNRGASFIFDTLRDLLGDELSILRHPAQQRRAARVLPCEAKKVEVRNVGSPSLVANDPVGVEDGKIDPRIIGLVTRRPDHSVDL